MFISENKKFEPTRKRVDDTNKYPEEENECSRWKYPLAPSMPRPKSSKKLFLVARRALTSPDVAGCKAYLFIVSHEGPRRGRGENFADFSFHSEIWTSTYSYACLRFVFIGTVRGAVPFTLRDETRAFTVDDDHPAAAPPPSHKIKLCLAGNSACRLWEDKTSLSSLNSIFSFLISGKLHRTAVKNNKSLTFSHKQQPHMFQRVQQMSRQMCFGQFNWYFWHRMSEENSAVNCLIMWMERRKIKKIKKSLRVFGRSSLTARRELGECHLPSIKYIRNPGEQLNIISHVSATVLLSKIACSAIFIDLAPPQHPCQATTPTNEHLSRQRSEFMWTDELQVVTLCKLSCRTRWKNLQRVKNSFPGHLRVCDSFSSAAAVESKARDLRARGH